MRETGGAMLPGRDGLEREASCDNGAVSECNMPILAL
jgi:hypothetical protein